MKLLYFILRGQRQKRKQAGAIYLLALFCLCRAAGSAAPLQAGARAWAWAQRAAPLASARRAPRLPGSKRRSHQNNETSSPCCLGFLYFAAEDLTRERGPSSANWKGGTYVLEENRPLPLVQSFVFACIWHVNGKNFEQYQPFG